uniref:Uncharacterized protein n=1 Tax=Arundo donax TaxID=35708 RepID=A0A0A9FZJ0_ARUDO
MELQFEWDQVAAFVRQPIWVPVQLERALLLLPLLDLWHCEQDRPSNNS